MVNQSALNVLLADNPWLEGDDSNLWKSRHLPEKFIERKKRIELDEKIALLVGPRQAGKSTLIWKTLSRSDVPCLLLNCEERAIRDWARSPAVFVHDLKQIIPSDTIVFFEEIQHLDEAGLFLKGLVDRKSGYSFVATGSSSFDLESKTRESLAGRANRHLLLPFSSQELASENNIPTALRKKRQHLNTEHLLIYGGYPTVYLSKKKQAVLTALLESFVIRDASDRFRIRHTEAFRGLLELMASQIGNLCNFTDWAAGLGISADTVREYATILCDSHVVKFLRPFVGGKRAEITSTPKVYFIDNGIRNRLFAGFSPWPTRADRGPLLENYVFTEMYKNINPILDSIRFWRSKSGAEVDFVLEREQKLTGIEVKAGDSRGKLTRSAHSFIDAYQPEKFWVVNSREHESFSKKNTQVNFVTPDDIQVIFET